MEEEIKKQVRISIESKFKEEERIRAAVFVLKNKTGIDRHTPAAIGALAKLASQGAANKRLIETSGGIPLLVGLLREVLQDRDGREFSLQEKMAAEEAARALGYLDEDSQVAAIAACGGRRQLEAFYTYYSSPNTLDWMRQYPLRILVQGALERLPPEIPIPAIPSGEGTRVAMFSARFDGGPVEETLGLVSAFFLFNRLVLLGTFQTLQHGVLSERPQVFSGNFAKSTAYSGITSTTCSWSLQTLERVLLI